MVIKKSNEAEEQHTFVQYLEYKKVIVIPSLGENIWSGVVVQYVKPKSKAIRIIQSIERKLKYLGKRKGIPDLFIAEPTKRYCGMYVEMKFGRNKPTKEQEIYLELLAKKGYYCVVCYSAKEAIAEFKKYISFK